MIDIHAHILPSIDDGAKDLNESLALLNIAYSDGITHMVATPHIHLGRYNNSYVLINEAFTNLKICAKNAKIDINLALAAEVRLDVELMSLIIRDQIPFIGKKDAIKYLLLELPHSHVPQGFDKFINWLSSRNIIPIIPHPERNRDIKANYSYISDLKQLGCEFQLTASSIEGLWGEQAKQVSLTMLKADIVSYVATDAHSVRRRPPILSNAKQIVSDLIGSEKAHNLFDINPRNLTASLFND